MDTALVHILYARVAIDKTNPLGWLNLASSLLRTRSIDLPA